MGTAVWDCRWIYDAMETDGHLRCSTFDERVWRVSALRQGEKRLDASEIEFS